MHSCYFPPLGCYSHNTCIKIHIYTSRLSFMAHLCGNKLTKTRTPKQQDVNMCRSPLYHTYQLYVYSWLIIIDILWPVNSFDARRHALFKGNVKNRIALGWFVTRACEGIALWCFMVIAVVVKKRDLLTFRKALNMAMLCFLSGKKRRNKINACRFRAAIPQI